MKAKNVIVAVLMLGMALVSCDKQGQSKMTVRMTDAPGDFEHVFVDVQEVQVHYSGGGNPGAWVSLQTNAGIYDLLTLQNGITTVLAPNTVIPSGKITQIRLILNTQNSVVVDGLTFPLQTSSATQTGLKINLNTVLDPGEDYEVLLDFDAEKSIVLEGNGSYSLKPTIKVLSIVQL
ncbi:MAG: DUF4382 domain-containing protein [Bacteroidota bacterium]